MGRAYHRTFTAEEGFTDEIAQRALTTLPLAPTSLEVYLSAFGLSSEGSCDGDYVNKCREKRVLPNSSARLEYFRHPLGNDPGKFLVSGAAVEGLSAGKPPGGEEELIRALSEPRQYATISLSARKGADLLVLSRQCEMLFERGYVPVQMMVRWRSEGYLDGWRARLNLHVHESAEDPEKLVRWYEGLKA